MSGRDQFLQVAMDSLPDGVIGTDRRGRIVYLNRAAMKMVSCSTATSVGKSWQEVFSLADDLAPMQLADPVIHCVDSAAHVNFSTGVMLRTRAGREVFVECYIAPVFDSAIPDRILGTVITIKDLTEISEMLAGVIHQSHDSLNTLLNLSQFSSRLQRILSVTTPAKEHVLLFMSVVGFEQLLLQLGPQIEDTLLRQLTQVLWTKVRSRDTLARAGTEEFVLLLEHCSSEQGVETANVLFDLIKARTFNAEGESIRLRMNVGVMPLSYEGLTASDVLRRARSACRMAHRSGKGPIMVLMNGGAQNTPAPKLKEPVLEDH